jgi:insulysin
MTGNLENLNKPEIRNEMIKFYKKYYTPDNLNICIVSSKSINEQKNLINKYFSLVPKVKTEPFKLPKPFYDEKNFGDSYQLIPVSDIQQLIYFRL